MMVFIMINAQHMCMRVTVLTMCVCVCHESVLCSQTLHYKMYIPVEFSRFSLLPKVVYFTIYHHTAAFGVLVGHFSILAMMQGEEFRVCIGHAQALYGVHSTERGN